MIDFLMAEYGLSAEQGYVLCSVGCDLKISQAVNAPNWTVSALSRIRLKNRRANVWEAVGGFIGVETLLPLLLTQVAEGRLTLQQLVRLTSENPARLYGYHPQKGSLAVGGDADFVLVDLEQHWLIDQARLHSKHKVTPYCEWPVAGRPVATYLRGECVARNDEIVGPPRGQHLRPGLGATRWTT